MEKTSTRLRQGALAMRQYYAYQTEYRKRQTPKVDYPEKVVVVFLDKVVLSPRKGQVEFIERTYFRKVEGYHQVAGQKIRDLSPVQSKDKVIAFPVLPTLNFFATLQNNPTPLLAENALAIIAMVDDVKLYPAFAQIAFLEACHKGASEKIARTYKDELAAKESAYQAAEKDYLANAKALGEIDEKLSKNEAEFSKCFDSLVNFAFAKPRIARSVLTLGLASNTAKLSRCKGRCDRLEQERESLVRMREDFLANQDVVIKAYDRARFAYDEISYRNHCAQIVEDGQFEQDKAHVAEPFVDYPVRDVSLPPAPSKEQTAPRFASFVRARGDEAFVPIKDPSLQSYHGLGAVGCLLFHNVETDHYFITASKDIGAALNKAYRLGVFGAKRMRDDAYGCQTRPRHLYEVCVVLTSLPAELKATYFRLRSAYLAAYVSL